MELGLPLPVGVSDYRITSKEYYYVDKTMFIKDFLDERPMVSLFTRPRRFGKTLNSEASREIPGYFYYFQRCKKGYLV